MRKVLQGIRRSCAIASLLLAGGCAVPPPGGVVSGDREAGRPTYFTVDQSQGAYWFTRGERPFLSLGVNYILERETNPWRGWQPYTNGYDGLARHGGDRAAWMAETGDRLKDWGFNTIAAWSQEELAAATGIPETRCVWLGGVRQDPDLRLIDVWSPAYREGIEALALKYVAPCAGHTNLIGFFVNNELPWYGANGWPSGGKDSLVSRYMALPPEAAGKQQLVSFLTGWYQTNYAAFARDWRVESDGFDGLRSARSISPRDPKHALAVEEWAGRVAEEYFRLTDEALLRHAPHHLNLGARFAGRPYAPVMAACARYADVVSLNDYRPHGHFDGPVMDAVAALVQKPILITEMSWRATENQSGCPNHGGAPVTVATQRERAEAFRRYVTEALKRPYIIGYHWFCWADQPPGGRFDGEDSNYGLVDIRGDVYALVTDAMREVNGQASELHRAGRTGKPKAAPELLAAYRAVFLPEAPPASAPFCFAMDAARAETWSDPAFPPSVSTVAGGTGLRVRTHAVRGWGGGVTLRPPTGTPQHSDGSYAVPGVERLVLRLDAPAGLRLSVVLNESGVGPSGQQAYHGLGDADGESYMSSELVTTGGEQTIEVDLRSLAPNQAHGNGRGNHIVDLGFLYSVDVVFWADQADAECRLQELCLAPGVRKEP